MKQRKSSPTSMTRSFFRRKLITIEKSSHVFLNARSKTAIRTMLDLFGSIRRYVEPDAGSGIRQAPAKDARRVPNGVQALRPLHASLHGRGGQCLNSSATTFLAVEAKRSRPELGASDNGLGLRPRAEARN